MKNCRSLVRAALLFALASLLALEPAYLLPVSHGQTAAAAAPGLIGKVRWGYYVAYDENSFLSLKEHIGELTHLSPWWYKLDGQGNLITTGDKELADPHREEVVALARARGVLLLPMVKNQATYGEFHSVLAQGPIRNQAIQGIVALAMEGVFAGIHIDFEGIDTADRPLLSAFMAQLAAELRPKGKLVTQAIAAKIAESYSGWAGPFDYASLGQSNDLLVLMAYGYGVGKPQSTAPFAWVRGSTAYAASQIPSEKLLLGVPFYGYDWNLSQGGSVRALRYAETAALIQTYRPTVNYDQDAEGPSFAYRTADGQNHEVWYEDQRSADARLDLVFQHGLAGAAGWRMGHEDPKVWDSLRGRLAYRTWFLAEGATGSPFHTWLLLMNPNPDAARATVTFMREDGQTVRKDYQLKPTSRLNIFANQVVPDAAFSTRVETDRPIFVERAMYFGYDGHNSAGVNAPSRRWFLPEGSTQAGMHTWVLLMNPNPEPAAAKVTFMMEDGQTLVQEHQLSPTSRLNIFVNQVVPDADFSTKVEANAPIVAERATYFDTSKGGHGSTGVSFASQRWLLAEGFTGHTTRLLLMNPNSQPAQVALSLLVEGGQPLTRTFSLLPTSRKTIDVNNLLPNNTAFATLVEADSPIVAERSSYWGASLRGHSTIGVAAPARTWYLAEGSTAYPFHDFVLLMNPGQTAAQATATFMAEDGRTVSKEYTLAPRSRLTIDANQVMPNTALSVRIQSDSPIVAERAMYFGTGGHSGAGISQ